MKIKLYAILLSVIVFIGFLVIGIIIYHDPTLIGRRSQIVYLDIDSMKEANDSIIDSVGGPAVEAVFPAGHQNNVSDTTLWADAYLCSGSDKTNLGDTLLLLLDTEINNKLNEIKYPGEYWTGLKRASKLKRCKIVVPADQLKRIKRATYKFAHVTLITDD